MGAYVPGSCGRFSELSDLEDEREMPDAKTMILRLYKDNERLLQNLMPAYHAAEAAMNHGFSNLLAERMSAHKKHGWMLRASLKD
jgi:starvation-inducible DNA-binding protein